MSFRRVLENPLVVEINRNLAGAGGKLVGKLTTVCGEDAPSRVLGRRTLNGVYLISDRR